MSNCMEEGGKPLDKQVGGSHYKNLPVQPGFYSEVNKLSFFEGDIVKRITRWRRVGGKGREDLEKAIHEAQMLIQLLDQGDIEESPHASSTLRRTEQAGLPGGNTGEQDP